MAQEVEKKTHSKELLNLANENRKERAVFSLLQEKKRSAGTFKVGPSSALQMVKQFLPQLQAANTKLETELQLGPDTQSKYDIEHIDEETKELIEMNLALYEDADLADEDGEELNSDSDSDNSGSVDEDNLKLPGIKKPGGLIQEVEVVSSDVCSELK